MEVLVDLADREDLAVEDWGTLRRLCRLCSEGRPHEHHQVDLPTADAPAHLGVAAREEAEAHRVFARWRRERSGCGVLALHLAYAH